ncbi:hypothetical protein FSW04_22740 [Baekduia soli]|uniref:Uncharacterized protein n=1 Tax=Baekduia soli TaxID=496014 RepID=A0A5B8UBU2_9ACTN|nr:hypothetical protein [Baekduia soli]QEC50111.1 hypothetical protein FSW04_22740 [Baekduia soli]
MSVLALKLLLAPSFLVVTSVVARRLGPHIAGILATLPVIAGPILLVVALDHGRGFGADAATASLLGLLSTTAFVVVYVLVARHRPWPVALAGALAAFGAGTALCSELHIEPVPGLLLAFAGFGLSYALLRVPDEVPGAGWLAPPPWDLPVRAVCAGGMVVLLTALSSGLGPHLSGLLSTFPIITSVLAAFTQAQRGSAEATRLLRGMLLGFFAFAAFCFTVAVSLRSVGIAGAFALASAVTILTQASILGGGAVGSRA